MTDILSLPEKNSIFALPSHLEHENLLYANSSFCLPANSDMTNLEKDLIRTFVEKGASTQEACSATDSFLESIMMTMLSAMQHTAQQARESAKQNRMVYERS